MLLHIAMAWQCVQWFIVQIPTGEESTVGWRMLPWLLSVLERLYGVWFASDVSTQLEINTLNGKCR